MNSSGSLHKTLIESKLTYIVAFVLPIVMMTALYITRKIYPFGEECYLRSDMYHQYAPFFSELWNKLKNGGSLTYSWDIGMGTNFTSLYAYYLASPINWFIVFFPQKYIIEVMNAIIILKIAGSSLSMTFYITKHFNTKSMLAPVFGVFYGMSGFIAAYSWNIMWLDCIILIPLIMLGLERLVNEDKCIFYCITLGLCIYTNYYISIMVCISVVLYFVALLFAYNKYRNFKIYMKKFLNFCLYSLLAGGLAACLLLPEMYTFSLSASSSSTFPDTLQSYFSIVQMFTRHLINVPVHMGLEHYPNIYCGVAVFILIPLYVMSKKISVREKIGKCVILVVFLTAFNLNIPNYIWHGFHFPNSLPCRQSFIYIFFLLTMCFEAAHNVSFFKNRQLGNSVWIAAALLVTIEYIISYDNTYSFKSVYLSGIFILIYALIMFLWNNSLLKPYVLLIAVFCVTVTECIVNMDSTGIGTTSRTSYLLDYDAVDTVTDEVAKNDNSFYRMDKIYGARSKNDGAWHNYKTVSTFSSTCNAGMSSLYALIGMESSTNAYGCNGLTAVTSSLFSVKYTISNKLLAVSDLREYYVGSDGEFIYKNNYTLPIGYAINSETATQLTLLEDNNGIENQNVLVASMTGIKDVFEYVDECISMTEYNFTATKSGHMYLTLESTTVDDIEVTINEKIYSFSNLKNNNRIIDVGYVNVGETINVSSEASMNLTAYVLNTSKFIRAYNELNSESYQVESFDDTHFKGTVTVSEDKSLLFSIPYDAGWSVYVDGKKVDTYTWQNALLCIDITEGTHTIELRYVPVNLILGCTITALCIIILVLIYVRGRRKRKVAAAGNVVLNKADVLDTVRINIEGMDTDNN